MLAGPPLLWSVETYTKEIYSTTFELLTEQENVEDSATKKDHQEEKCEGFHFGSLVKSLVFGQLEFSR